MGNSLLSIDWDYFISVENQHISSFNETKQSMIDLWYKRYFQGKSQGKNILESFQLSKEVDMFWDKIKQIFQMDQDAKVYVSDSHALSYDIAKKFDCHEVYLFDAHSDLGYGGLDSLNFEVNCANWVGQLLKQKVINKAHIFYSPFTKEKPTYFKQMNERFNIEYLNFTDLHNKIKTSSIHICRSGAWSPPWFDRKFIEFVNTLGMPFNVLDCPRRKWKPQHLTFAEQVQYMMA